LKASVSEKGWVLFIFFWNCEREDKNGGYLLNWV